MDDDGLSDTVLDEVEESSYERQKVALQTYLDALPYKAESVEDMHVVLEGIVGKIYICAKSQNWLLLSTWDGLLQCWLMMRYPLPTTTRAKLVRLYYELAVLPAVEPRIIRVWTDMVTRLIASKGGQKPKLKPADLELDWKPLWHNIKKEIWSMERIQDPTRNLVNILLYLAQECKSFFPTRDMPDMLSTLVPLTTKDNILTMVPVITSFLPLTHIHLYAPFLFRLWEAFNSGILDDRLLELFGDISEHHIAGTHGPAGEEGGAPWKDVGIWTTKEWNLIVSKGLGSMNVPVGAAKGAASTGSHADLFTDRHSQRIKKTISRFSALAKIFVYSISVDSPIRVSGTSTPSATGGLQQTAGCLAGSKALDSLDRLITSVESFFHPSNSGPWSQTLTAFLQHLASEFAKRVKEEELETCKTPEARRITPAIRSAFVKTLKTPILLAMFSKDPQSTGHTLGAIRVIASLEPKLIMPDLLERAYDGLEVVNETHRTTAVLNMLLAVIPPLVTEKTWLGGQKHILPLLELCLPGIDLNDPNKTLCATMFIAGVVQHIKIGDLSAHASAFTDAADDEMVVEQEAFPEGTEPGMPALSREEERALARESTAGFADWVTTLFRRVLALYENLPEEGGRRNTTGGRQEESVLKAIKNMMDAVCLHLSDPLFDLVLGLVFNYATTNAKSNAVKAFGQLVACLARVKPEQTTKKFLPFCLSQIRDELGHGASSLRTTSAHAAVASDTTLHWNLAIVRGCLGYGGKTLLKYKLEIIDLLALLIDKTKSERGFSNTGRLIQRILHTLAGVYPVESRFLNPSDWTSSAVDRDHNLYWGKLIEPHEAIIEWHVPSEAEIDFVLDILNQVYSPTMDKLENLLSKDNWDSADRNDFCRYLVACRNIWTGLPTFVLEGHKTSETSGLYDDLEAAALVISALNVQAGFTLTNSTDPKYQAAAAHRTRFGQFAVQAASKLQQANEGEDHIDAVLGVSRAIDVYLLDYGISKGVFEALQKSFTQGRSLNRIWNGQRENSRMVFVKRAQVYHSARVYMHSMYRQRSTLDDQLSAALVRLSLSPYTRVRRHAQAVLRSVFGHFIRSTRIALPSLFEALAAGNDPDRMKGALYILWEKGIASYALSDRRLQKGYWAALLECQHEEKPSIQKLVGSMAQDCLSHMHEEGSYSDAYSLPAPRLDAALQALEEEFSSKLIDHQLLDESAAKSQVRRDGHRAVYLDTISALVEIANRPQTHWRYIQIAARLLGTFIRRDIPVPTEVTAFFLKHSTSPQSPIRSSSLKALTKTLALAKVRSFSASDTELWASDWKNPMAIEAPIRDGNSFLKELDFTVNHPTSTYVDKLTSGFFSWSSTVKGYHSVKGDKSAFTWDASLRPTLDYVKNGVLTEGYFESLSALWIQESDKIGGTVEMRSDNVLFIKSLAKTYENDVLDPLLKLVDPLLADPDKFKQRAAGEILAGLLRGAKHWPENHADKLWEWTRSRLDKIFAQIKPDTLNFWGSVISYVLHGRDPRRSKSLIDWIFSLPLDLKIESAFEMRKSLLFFEAMIECLGRRFQPLADRYVDIGFENAGIGYAEIRLHVVQLLSNSVLVQWDPSYPSTESFLEACRTQDDPLRIRHATYEDRLEKLITQLEKWKDERYPPPRVNQSEYDKVALTLLLWFWLVAHSHRAPSMFPYVVPVIPEILRMTEVNDNNELQSYSSAVLYVLAAITPPPEYVEVILQSFIQGVQSSTSWRLRLNTLPCMVVFFYRNLLSISQQNVTQIMDVLLDCLADDNVEVREMASKMLSGVVRCSQRQSIIPLKDRFVRLIRKTSLPPRQDPAYAAKLKVLHSAVLGLCALMESFPYSVEPWMPSLTNILASHATSPPPISTTIRKCASEFKKTHQDTWHKDQHAFDEDQLQSLSTMLVGTSYYA